METNLTAFALQDIRLVLEQHNQQYNVIQTKVNTWWEYLIKGKQFLSINASTSVIAYNWAIMWWFLSTCCSQDGGLFQRSNRSDVDLLSKQNTSTYKNSSKNHTVTDITSCFNFVFYFRFTISMKTTAKRTTWVSQFHISLWLAFLESFWALWNFGRHDSSRGGTVYAVFLRGSSINFRENTLTQMTSCISLR